MTKNAKSITPLFSMTKLEWMGPEGHFTGVGV